MAGTLRVFFGRHESQSESPPRANGSLRSRGNSSLREHPDTQSIRTLKSQLIDAATSVAGNYRATCRARSRAEFVAKVGVVREEADEAYGWLCLLVETGALQRDVAAWHIKEAWELTAIFNASYLTAKRRLTGKKRQEPKSGDDPNPTPNPSIPE